MSRIIAVYSAEHVQFNNYSSETHDTNILAITNVRVFDGEDMLENQTVLIEKKESLSDSSETNVIDATGMTLLPGFIDAHVHISGPNVDKEESTQSSIALLKHMAKCGITTALDMGRMPKAHRDSLRHHAALTDIRFVGNFATATGTTHSKMVMATTENLVDSPEQAVQFVQNRIAEGADYIKIVADIPGPTQEVVNTLASEAAKHGKLSVAHASRSYSFKMAQDGNVNIITHVPLDVAIDEAAARRMARDGQACVPTLVMEEALAKAAFRPGMNYQASRDSVTQLHLAGVPIIAGTDSNQSIVAPVKHGEDYFRELDLLSEAGLTNLEVIKAATTLPARYFKLMDRGAILKGKRADLVLINGNPLEDLQMLRNVRQVWIGGLEINLST